MGCCLQQAKLEASLLVPLKAKRHRLLVPLKDVPEGITLYKIHWSSLFLHRSDGLFRKMSMKFVDNTARFSVIFGVRGRDFGAERSAVEKSVFFRM